MEKQYYISKEQYETIKKSWAEHKHSAPWHIIYNILRSKDAALGFTERTKHIQCNDAWWGFNSSLDDARRFTSSKNPWEQYKDPSHPHHRMYASAESRIKENQAHFKVGFGIDMPEDLHQKLCEVERKK